MLIDARDIGKIRAFTIRARANSDTWCTYDGASLWIEPGDLLGHRDRETALRYREHNMSDRDIPQPMPVRLLETYVDALTEQVHGLDEEKVQQRTLFLETGTAATEREFDNDLRITGMEEKKIQALEKRVFYTGLGDIPRETLRENIAAGQPSFQIGHTQQYGKDEAKATLNFKRSDQGNYFFNSFDLEVKNEEGQVKKQNFRVRYGNTFTLKEAYNLMMGRSVNKDFIKVDEKNPENNKVYNAWAYEEKSKGKEGENTAQGVRNPVIKKVFGFDAEKIVSQLPIKNLDYNMDDLMSSIKRGNRQSVIFSKEGKDEQMYIEADARSRDIKVFDANLEPQLLSLRKGQAKNQGRAGDKKEERTENKNKEAETVGRGARDSDKKKARGNGMTVG